MQVIVGALSMIKKGTDEQIVKITGCPSKYEILKNMHFAELLISIGEYYQCEWKNNTQKKQQKTNNK